MGCAFLYPWSGYPQRGNGLSEPFSDAISLLIMAAAVMEVRALRAGPSEWQARHPLRGLVNGPCVAVSGAGQSRCALLMADVTIWLHGIHCALYARGGKKAGPRVRKAAQCYLNPPPARD